MLEYLFYIIKENPISYGAVSFLFGTLFGHWLAISRDKRVEFNAAASPIRVTLLQQLDKVRRKGFVIHDHIVSNDDFAAFSERIGTLFKGRYQRDVNDYFKCFNTPKHIASSGIVYKRDAVDRDALEKAIKNLLKHFKLK